MYQLNDTRMWRQRGEDLPRDVRDERLTARHGGAGLVAAALGFLVALLVAGLVLMATSAPASAATTFTVDSTSDAGDANLTDNACDANPLASVTLCTLRAAVQEANDTSGADAIEFDIPGEGVKTISPNSAYKITDQVTIDGYSQPGSSPNTLVKGTNAEILIEIDGSNVGDDDGLIIGASGTVVRGLAINRFRGRSGIRIGDIGVSTRGVKIEGNFIGTDASGTRGLGNQSGVAIQFASSPNITSANTIGGSTPESRNLISANEFSGVSLFTFPGNEVAGNRVQGNLIGTDRSGTRDLGNGDSGVSIRDAVGTVVGGPTRASANTIAFNGGDGVGIGGSVSKNNRVLSNSIFSNGGLGIDLLGPDENISSDVRTANDPRDADTGPNGLQNEPAVTSATNAVGETTVKGRLLGKPNLTFVVRFYFNPAGQNEGKTFIGQERVKTDSDGKGAFSFISARAVGAGKTVTATATGAEGTSEFSAPRTVKAR